MAAVFENVVVEESKSRSGRHMVKRICLIMDRDGVLSNPLSQSDRIISSEDIKPTYARGWARRLGVKIMHGEYLIQLRFVRNFLGKVKGLIEVYNHRGELIYRAKYCDGELRRSIGNPIYAWIIRLIAERLRIPVKSTRLGDEGGA